MWVHHVVLVLLPIETAASLLAMDFHGCRGRRPSDRGAASLPPGRNPLRRGHWPGASPRGHDQGLRLAGRVGGPGQDDAVSLRDGAHGMRAELRVSLHLAVHSFLQVVNDYLSPAEPLARSAQSPPQGHQEGAHLRRSVFGLSGGLYHVLLLRRLPGQDASRSAPAGQGRCCADQDRRWNMRRHRLLPLRVEYIARGGCEAKGYRPLRGTTSHGYVASETIYSG